MPSYAGLPRDVCWNEWHRLLHEAVTYLRALTMVSGYMFSLIISRNFASVLTHHHGWATGRASIGELENIGAAAHRRPSATAQLRLRTKFSNFRDSQSSMIITIKILTCPILHASACLIGETRNQDMIHLKCRDNGETAHSCCQGDSDPLVDTSNNRHYSSRLFFYRP